MIEGLKVTVLGTELRDLCAQRSTHHADRKAAYDEQVASMEAAKVEGMNYSGGDPIRALKEKAAEHATQADEMAFIAAHINLGETYLLDRDALHRLGICANRY